MSCKRWIGLLVIIAGIALIIFSRYEKGRIDDAKGTISKGRSFMPDNPVSNTVGGIFESQAEQYDAPVLYCLIGGIVLVVIGGGLMICCCGKKRR